VVRFLRPQVRRNVEAPLASWGSPCVRCLFPAGVDLLRCVTLPVCTDAPGQWCGGLCVYQNSEALHLSVLFRTRTALCAALSAWGAGSLTCPGCQTSFPVQHARGRMSPVQSQGLSSAPGHLVAHLRVACPCLPPGGGGEQRRVPWLWGSPTLWSGHSPCLQLPQQGSRGAASTQARVLGPQRRPWCVELSEACRLSPALNALLLNVAQRLQDKHVRLIPTRYLPLIIEIC
jgi:hypothetical protein